MALIKTRSKKRKPKMKGYEVTFKYVGKEKPKFVHTEYGFGTNPPTYIVARNKAHVKKQLRLPKSVKIQKIRKA